MRDVTGAVLAGGKSLRMGTDKATLLLEGRTLFDRVIQVMTGIFENVMIAGHRPDLERPGVPSYADLYPGSALGGLHTALVHAPTPWVFVIPCDLPYPSGDLIRSVASARGDDVDAVVPRTSAGIEPLVAAYRRTCLAPVERLLEGGRFRITELYDSVRVLFLEEDRLPPDARRALVNINTREDLARIREGG